MRARTDWCPFLEGDSRYIHMYFKVMVKQHFFFASSIYWNGTKNPKSFLSILPHVLYVFP